jgi:hypothetical protein
MLDLPEAGADEREMTLGGLRNRIAAYQREERWAPRHVAAELGQTNREAQQAETNAQIWKARADQLDNPQDAEELRARADQALLQAGELRMRAADLQKADDARALWWAHTTATREAAERAKVELASRGIDVNDTSDHVTGEEWLAEQERLRAQEEAQLAASMQALPDEELVDEPEPAAAETNAEPAETLDPAGESEADDNAAAPPDDADTTVDDADTPPREDRANDREDEPVDREDDREEPANAQVDEPAADGSQPTPEPQRDADQDEPEPAAADQDDEPEPAKPWVETDVPDIRDTAKPDPTEHADPSPRDRVPERDEAAEAAERAHQALLEMQQRAEEDRWREEREKNERAAQWADTDDDEPAAKDADVPELVDD